MDIVSAIVERVALFLLHAALRQIGYLLHYNHNIKSLKKQVQTLADKRERLHGKIDTAKINGEMMNTEVQKWIEDADKITAEAEKFLDDEVKANKRCLRGRCVNIWSVYRFSKEALHKAKVISKILEDGKFGIVSSHPTPAPENVSLSEGFSGERKEEKGEGFLGERKEEKGEGFSGEREEEKEGFFGERKEEKGEGFSSERKEEKEESIENH